MSRDLFDSAGDEALAAVGEQMVVAAELLLLVVVCWWWWCGVQPRSTFTPPPPLHNWLCCLCNPGQLACHGSPQKRENIFTLLLLRSRITSLLALCRSRAHCGVCDSLWAISTLWRALRLSHTLRRPARALQRLLLLRRHWPAPSAGLGQRDEPSRHSGRTIENRGQQTRPGLPPPLHLR